ncbi:DUF6226 family protein [Jatrophihabitans fulvus]
MDLTDLVRDVDAAFAVTGADTPRWDDPHHGRDVRDEEYSRVTDPQKYRIVTARAHAWERAVTTAGLAIAHRDDEGVELRPLAPGALPVRFRFMTVDDVPRTGVVVTAGGPALDLVHVPDCGCDACDSGSDGLLDQIDEHVAAVVSGELVRVTLPNGWVMSTGPGSYQGSFRGDGSGVDIHVVADEARAGNSSFPVLRGEPWF